MAVSYTHLDVYKRQAIDKSQQHVEGEVTLKLYKGNVMVIGRESPKSVY